MNEHGWPDFPGDHHEPSDAGWPDHHEPPPDDGQGHDDGLWDVPPQLEHDDAGQPDDPGQPYWAGDDDAGHAPHGDPGAAEPAGHESTEPVTDAAGVVGAEPDAYAEPLPDTEFPPAVDVGPLPEPVDGFPWIDAAGLGDAGPVEPHLDPVDPHDLAGYAGVDLPPDGDPWTLLAASPDPATAALARWWAAQFEP